MKWSKFFLSFVLFLTLDGISSPSAALTEKGFKKLHVFTTILHYVEDNYVEGVNEQELIEGAIQGMLRSLDPHTVYLSPEIYRELKVDTRGHFDGVGIEVTIRDGILTVVSPIRGTPAESMGVTAGDQIIKIDGRSTETMNLSEAVKSMRGKRGSKVALTLLRPETKKRYEVTIVRQVIRIPSVKAELLDERYAYVSISSFQQDTAKALRRQLKKLSPKKSIDGLILDLRRNPGGLLDEAVRVSDLFLKEGVITTTESRGVEIDRRVATERGTEPDYPMIVMVDGGSASASEIVAGALQDNNRAVILGEKTFGKGSVQTVIDLDDGGGLKLTVAKYFTPSGKSIQATGIIPNIIVPTKGPEQQQNRPRIREKDLRGHLKGEDEEKEVDNEIPTEGDYQKQVALDYLRSWTLFQKSDPNISFTPGTK